MKIGDWVTIRGLTHKTKNRIRNHGEEWIVIRKTSANPRMFLFQEVNPKDVFTPYCFWGEIGIDLEWGKHNG